VGDLAMFFFFYISWMRARRNDKHRVYLCYLRLVSPVFSYYLRFPVNGWSPSYPRSWLSMILAYMSLALAASLRELVWQPSFFAKII
jgi:hypothetical protein